MLYVNKTKITLYKQQLEAPHEELLSDALHSVEMELRKLAEIPWLYYVFQPNDDEVSLIGILGVSD